MARPLDIENEFSIILQRLSEIETFRPRSTRVLSNRSFFSQQEKTILIKWIETIDKDDDEVNNLREGLLLSRINQEEFLRGIDEYLKRNP